MLLRIGLVGEGALLVLYIENSSGVMDGAVLIVVVADGAVEHVVLENAVEGFALGDVDGVARGDDVHARRDLGSTGSYEVGWFSCRGAYLHHTGVAAFDGTHLGDVADLRERFVLLLLAVLIDDFDEKRSGSCGNTRAVESDLRVGSEVVRVY